MGDEQSPVAYIVDPTSKNFMFPGRDLNIEPPAYNMTIEHGVSDGRSEFIIESATLDDNRLFWCTVSSIDGVNDVDSLRLSVNGKLYKFYFLSYLLIRQTTFRIVCIDYHDW